MWGGQVGRPHGCGKHNKGECWVKFRLFRLVTTVAMLAVLIEALGAGAKWG